MSKNTEGSQILGIYPTLQESKQVRQIKFIIIIINLIILI